MKEFIRAFIISLVLMSAFYAALVRNESIIDNYEQDREEYQLDVVEGSQN